MNAARLLNVYTGQEAGAEAAIDAIYDIYNDEHSEAVLLVDAENAFSLFSLVSHFYTPWKHQKTFGFLTFSDGIEMWHWTKMG